jgi:hypothetical protein
MSPDDRGFLEKVLTLRHKIVHCDFQAARRVLSELGIVIAGGSVWKGDLTSGDNSQVTDLTKRQGRNIGWFLEAGSSGLFARAAETFKRALQLIDRLG